VAEAVQAPPRLASVHLLPAIMAIGAGIVWSFGALFARLAKHTDAWQYLFWRSIGILVVMEVIAAVRRQGSTTRKAFTSGMPMIVGCVMLLTASLGFVYAVKNTTAANASFLGSLTPLMAVGIARVYLGERLTRVTIGAIALATVGLAVTVLSDVGAGNMPGNIAALLAALGFAGYTVCVRSSTAQDWSPVMPGYACMMIVLCSAVTLVNGRTLLPSLHDISLAVLHGGVIIVVGTFIFNAASRSVPAVAMTVFAQSEMVFVPIWVLVFIGEVPKITALLGGAIILTAVIGKVVLDARGQLDEQPSTDLGPGTIA
jgi:RarD protein